MEDGLTNVESLVPPPNPNSEDGSKREEEKEEVEEGFEKVKEEDVGKDDKDGGGLNNLISFITPLSPSMGKPSQHESDDDSGGDDGGKEGVDGCGKREGGVISKMVSNFFHQGEGEGEDEEEIMAGEKVKRLKTEDGGIIHNIASVPGKQT